MVIALPSFILGYHGCDQAIAEKVFAGQASLEPSQNDYDWLGNGIYFWEHNPQRAYDFAVAIKKHSHPSKQTVENPAVVGAIINLGYCLNLLDSGFIKMVKQAHCDLSQTLDKAGESLPQNTGGLDLVDRKLDCAVFRMLHKNREGNGDIPFDTVRAAFVEGAPIYPNAGFASKNHIQLAVRNTECIHGYFRPLDEKGNLIQFG